MESQLHAREIAAGGNDSSGVDYVGAADPAFRRNFCQALDGHFTLAKCLGGVWLFAISSRDAVKQTQLPYIHEPAQTLVSKVCSGSACMKSWSRRL
jgi:hypothetical protein